MHHIDEHTIELYILGSELVKEQTAEIESHLKECHGCRTLAGQMEAFYKNAEENLDKLPKSDEQKSRAIMPFQKDLTEYDIPLGSRVPYKPTTAVAKFWYFVYRHPIPSAVTSFATVAAMVLGINYSITDLMKDKNPAYPHLNPNNATIEIYNKENQMLWFKKADGIYQLPPKDYEKESRKVMVADLSGDKNNEVITILNIDNHPASTAPLSVLSAEGRPILEKYFNEDINFRGRKYDGRLGCQSFICYNDSGSEEKEICVVANSGRSPNIIYRLSNEGDILGQYFHFGNGNIKYIWSESAGKIVFFGENDTPEPDSLPYAIMSVLEPSKLSGKTEAGGSDGFGLQKSSAELYIIRFPLTDMNYLWNTKAYVGNFKETVFNNVRAISVWITGAYGYGGDEVGTHPIFEYIFSSNFEIIDVKYDSETLNTRKIFVEQGKLSNFNEQEYLNNLKKSIRYWNGKEWQKEWTMVKH